MIGTEQFYIPESKELEESILGAILVEPDCMDDISSILTPDMFHTTLYKVIYNKISEFYVQGLTIDIFTVYQALKDRIDENGGAVMLSSLTAKIASSIRAKEHALIIRELYILRYVMNGSLKIYDLIRSKNTLDTVFSELNKLHTDSTNLLAGAGEGLRHIKTIVNEAVEEASNRQELRLSGKSVAVPTGLIDLNIKTGGGLRKGELVIVAARPAMGKSAFMLHMALSAASQGIPVNIYSLEMSDISLVDRLIIGLADINPDRYKQGDISKEEWESINRAQNYLSSLPIYIDPNPKVSIKYAEAMSRKKKKEGKCGLVLFDYLQLADMDTGNKNRSREQEVTIASKSAKTMAKSLDVPVVMLSQLSRKVEEREDKMPLLSDLRESGSIEQDADIVMFLYRPAYYGIKQMETNSLGTVSTEGMGILSVAKQRNGALGLVPFKHNSSLTKISDYH